MTTSEDRKAILVPRSERGRATRARLLRAAEASFGENGYAGASVSDVVRRAGVSQGSFYVYFPSKESIFEELILEISREIRRVTSGAASKESSRAEAEISGALAFFGWLQDHKYLHRILHQIDQFDEVLAQRFYRSIADGYMHGLAESMQTGEIDTVDPELLAFSLMGISHFVSMKYVLWEDGGFPRALHNDFGRIIRNVLSSTKTQNADPEGVQQ